MNNLSQIYNDNLSQIINLAKVKSIDLRKQREALWNYIYNTCEIHSSIYEYNLFSDITIICKHAKKTATIISKDLNKRYKYITIHEYLKGKENIISLNGEKIIYIYEDEINNKVKKRFSNYADAQCRLFYLSRIIYNPALFLDIIKYKTDENYSFKESQLIILNEILKCFKILIKDKFTDIKLGDGYKHIITKKKSNILHEEEIKIKNFIKKMMSLENNNGVFAVANNNEGPVIATSDSSWDFIKKIKTVLNKSKFNNNRYDRFYYEINKDYIYNDFRLAQISLIDRKNNNILMRLYNNLDYEAIPVIEKKNKQDSYYIMHEAVYFRFILYDIIFNDKYNYNLTELFNMFRRLLSRDITSDIKSMDCALFYVGQYIDDKVEKIKLGGSMKRL
jgi:hypothetical protein